MHLVRFDVDTHWPFTHMRTAYILKAILNTGDAGILQRRPVIFSRGVSSWLGKELNLCEQPAETFRMSSKWHWRYLESFARLC